MNVVRIGDIAVGTCYRHSSPQHVTGHVISGSSNTTCNRITLARCGDIVLFNCGHTGVIVSRSKNTCNNIPIAKITDYVVGGVIATLISGSPNTNTN